ncbi:hypothetical protein [Alkalitalea saponilacus]|uniref:hypothetical protein n=1 Tax=Alkalitalea saponilacus TaxID=889453 RepID=UPI002936E4A4|nr:hypothetical protein [Alkalitalea saponilacus]
MKVDFSKTPDGLVPAIIQDSKTNKVLMLGYMNEEALEKNKKRGESNFFQQVENNASDERRRIWHF